MEAIRGVRLRKFKLRKIILGVRMHFRHNYMNNIALIMRCLSRTVHKHAVTCVMCLYDCLLWECNDLVCSFDVLGSYDFVCRRGDGDGVSINLC